MKHYSFLAKISFFGGLVATMLFPLPILAATVNLATGPLATSTTTVVKPNVLFVLDDSGSMDWDHMPDDSADVGSSVVWQFGYYGLRSSQCNQVYYDPNVTYDPPVNDAYPAVSYPNASFTAAWIDGFNTGAGTKNLSNSFKASQSMNTDANNQAAYYYTYSGAQTTSAQKYYHDTSNTFFAECSAGRGSTANGPASGVSSTLAAGGSGNVFTKVNLTARTATITISGTSSTSVSGITVNGAQIMSGTAPADTDPSVLANSVVSKINACSVAVTGACGVSGYTATTSGSVVTILGPTSANTYTPSVSKSGGMSFTVTAFPTVAASTATNITDPVKLQNFANWYSYYRTRMLMMKTSAGQAFGKLDNTSYRVGLLQLSSSTAPTVPLAPFSGTVRTNWFNSFYGISPSGSTPLRVALSNAGRYYGGLLGTAVANPVEYSCQQNFSIMSTDGYWNGGTGFQLDGSTLVGNQDDLLARPYYDGATTVTTWTNVYTRFFYSKVTTGCGGGGSGKLKTQPQIGSCTPPTPTGSCVPAGWSNTGIATTGTVCSTTAAPAATAATFLEVSQNTSGGKADTLADVAAYYYNTDLRTPALNNCTAAVSGELLCSTPVAPEVDDPYNNVFTSNKDKRKTQHMTTFTLGLGASGRMNYIGGYEKPGTSADYDAINTPLGASSTVCKWQASGTCNWPLPGQVTAGGDGLIENIDDLWHAAVNGHGTYFSATNPETLSAGLANALAGINTRRGAASAAATSTLNPVAGNNLAFLASYTTSEWTGNLEGRGINTDTGAVSENATWCVETIPAAGTCSTPLVPDNTGNTTVYNCETPSPGNCPGGAFEDFSGSSTSGSKVCKVQVATACTGTMNSKVLATSDYRKIKTANSTGNGLIDFDASYATANPTYFNTARISSLNQWTNLDSTQQANALGGTSPLGVSVPGLNLLNYLRGQSGYQDNPANSATNRVFRNRSAVLGDALESQPAYLGKPVFSYPYPGYSTFKTTWATRRGMIYMGTNDGMMHAFYAQNPTSSACIPGANTDCGGDEAWAYVPSMVIPNMYKLADDTYSTKHSNFVNGSAITSDVCVANCSNTSTPLPVWKTILVAGLNGGGRGYYALDITDATIPPKLLWEFTTMAGVGAAANYDDDDVGYSYGQPVITQKPDGTWVVLVTSGYNNVSPGSGLGYLYVLNPNTGAIISKISTGAGDTTTPSGLAKIAGWNEVPPGNQVKNVYGGDLHGNLWKFDISDTVTNAVIGKGSVKKMAKLYSDTTSTDTATPTAAEIAARQPIMTTPVLGKVDGNRVIYIATGKYLETGDLSSTPPPQQQTQYAIKDNNSATFINPRNSGGLMVKQTMVLTADGNNRTITASATKPDFSTGRGWFVDFLESGERVNIDATLIQGVLVVPSIVPSNTSCSPGGHGWLNYFDYKSGAGVVGSGSGSGSTAPASAIIVSERYDHTIVGITTYYVNGEVYVGVVTDDNPKPEPPDDLKFPPSGGKFTGKRSLWRELTQ